MYSSGLLASTQPERGLYKKLRLYSHSSPILFSYFDEPPSHQRSVLIGRAYGLGYLENYRATCKPGERFNTPSL